MLLKLIKFCVVGASGLLVDFSITFLLKEKIGMHRYAANATGFLCAASSNFLLNRYWTFQSQSVEVYREFSLFLMFSLAGLGINTFFLFFFEKQKLNFYLAKLLAIVVTMLWNFTTNYFFTFGPE